MFGKSAIDLGKNVVSGFDGEKGKAVDVTDLEVDCWIKGGQNNSGYLRIH
jgi:hypothetical protein